jgi:hypothetical protein
MIMPEQDGLSAAILQLSEHSGRIATLDERENGHFRELGSSLADLRALVTTMQGTLTDQADILAAVQRLDDQVTTLASRVDDIAPDEDDATPSYQPIPSPRWWNLDDDAREHALHKLRAWVEQVYRPSYGHLSGNFGRCWDQHTLCLITLDWLSELWSVLYLQPRRTARTLAGQGEFQTRLLPAAAEQMHQETTRCRHADTWRAGGPPRSYPSAARKP